MRISDWSSDVCSSDLGSRLDHVVEAEDDPFGLAGSAGGVEDHRRIASLQLGDLAVVEVRMRAVMIAPLGLYRVEAMQEGLRIMAQAARFVVDEDRKSTRLNSSH